VCAEDATAEGEWRTKVVLGAGVFSAALARLGGIG
jgi:hypothetical protein